MAKRKQPEKPVEKLSDKHRKIVEELIEQEGFDYGFTNYCGELEKRIKNPKFHELRKKWEEARQALVDYMGTGDV